MIALDLIASAWTGITQIFLTLEIGSSYDELIRREDECRLLFIIASEGYERHLIWL